MEKKTRSVPRKLVEFWPMQQSMYNAMIFLVLKPELLHGLKPRAEWYHTVYSCISWA